MKTKGKAKPRGITQGKSTDRTLLAAPEKGSAGAPKPLPNSKQSWKLDDDDKTLLLHTLAVSPTIQAGANNFTQLSGIEITRQGASAVIAENRERYEAIFEDNRQRHYESPLLFAGNRARELNEMWGRCGEGPFGDRERVILLEQFRKESEILGVEAAPSAKAKEVEAFLRSVEFGQDDLGEVPEHARSTVHN